MSRLAILMDGIKVGSISGGRSAGRPVWTLSGNSPEARNHLKGTCFFGTIREAKAAAVARLSAPAPIPCACGEPKDDDFPTCIHCQRKAAAS